MGIENESRFIIAFDGQSGNLDQILSSLKSQFRATVSDLQKTASSLDLYSELLKQNGAVVSAVSETKKRFEDLKTAVAAIRDAGGTVGKELAASLKEAEKASLGAVKAYEKQRDTLQDMRRGLAAAGVDVKALASEQLRLAESIRTANAAALQQGNRDLLGVKNIQPQIAQLNAAFNSLVASGKASMGEVSVAAANLETKIASLKAEAGGAGAAFTAMKGALLGIVVAVGAVGAGVNKTASDFRAFTQGMAAIETIAETSKQGVADLAAGVRQLARDMGVDAVASTKALYDIIGSGIPTDNALKVLELSSRAAIAGLTDVGTAAKLGVSILNAYGLQVSQLGRVYDILFKVVQDGVVTFPELAQSIGDVLPTARSAKVPLEEVGAAMVLLTKNGLPAAEATTALTRTIQDLASPAPEAATAMRALGIEYNGLTGTIKQLAEKSLDLGQLRTLIPDIRAAKGVQILLQNYKGLTEEVDKVNEKSPSMQAAYAIMAATPQANIDRFNSALKDLSISVGQFVTGASGAIVTITGMLNSFNSMSSSSKSTTIEIVAIGAAFAAAFLLVGKMSVALNLLGPVMFGASASVIAFGEALTVARIAMIGLQSALAGFLGFEFGKQAYANSESVRFLGDALGIAAGRGANVAELFAGRLSAAFTGNAAAAKAANDRYYENIATLSLLEKSLSSGVTARLYDLQKQFESLQVELGKAATSAQKAATDLAAGVSAISLNVKGQLDAVDNSIARLQTQLQTLIVKLGENVKAAQDASTIVISTINAEAAARLAALSKNQADEVATATATAAIQKQLAADRLKAIGDSAKEITTAFEIEAKGRIEIAARMAGNIKQVEQDILVEKRGILQKIVADYKSHIAELIKQDTDRLTRIKELEQERLNIRQSIEDKIRDVTRLSLTVSEQYYDKQKQSEELLSKARAASAAGNLKLAEEFANRAIALGNDLSREVKEGETTIVDATTAGRNATNLYAAAQTILLNIVDKREQAEKSAQEANSKAITAAKAGLDEFSGKLAVVSAEAAKGLAINVTANVEAVTKILGQLDEELKTRKFLLAITADISLATKQVDDLKNDLAKGITVNVTAKTDTVTAALARIEAAQPELKVQIGEALGQIETVRKAAAALASVELRVQTNIDEVRKQIDSLKVPTESTHTIYVKRVETNATGGTVGYAKGGPVGAPVASYAQGGPVFRPPSWSKVPGSGNADTVPALLRRGSFVVRKAAARYYGDDLMNVLARGYASGGSVDRDGRATTSGGAVGTDQGATGQLPPIRAILAYASAILPYLRHPMFEILVKGIAEDRRTIESNADRGTKESAARHMLNATRAAADNFYLQDFWGKTTSGGGNSVHGRLTSFDDFFARWQKQQDDITERDKTSPYRHAFAAGGSAQDTVPAMLMPEEYVMQVPAVKKYGTGLMEQINRMMIPRERLRSMIAPPQRFATGGLVRSRESIAPTESRSGDFRRADLRAADGLSVTINANAGDILSTENVRRFVVPVLDDIMRRSRR